jgi:hypothetical protein
VPAALNGEKWIYIPSTAADCCEDADAVEAFDATFPPKERKWMPSREEFYIYSHSSVTRQNSSLIGRRIRLPFLLFDDEGF